MNSRRVSRSGTACVLIAEADVAAPRRKCVAKGAKIRSLRKKARNYMNFVTGLVQWASTTWHDRKRSSTEDLPMIVLESLSCRQQHRRHQQRHHQRHHHPTADSDAMAAGTDTRSPREFSLHESPTQHNESPAEAPLSASAYTSTAALDGAETARPPSNGESPPQPENPPEFSLSPLKFSLPAVEFSLRELAACTRGFGPDAMLAMDWAGAVYRGCCHVGKGHVGGRPGDSLHSDAPAATEAPRGSSAVAQPVMKRAESPADLCCCATCQELTATDCVTLRGGCARVKRWRYLPSSLPPPPPSTSAAANATGSTSNDQGAAASESMTSHTPEEAQSSGEVQSGEEVHSSVSAGREMMGRLAEAAASHPSLLPIVGFSCTEELLLVFRSHPSALSLESALARDAMMCGAGSPSALSSWSSRLSIARQIAGGLAHLHAHSFLHASLRPANVLLLPAGSTSQSCTPLPLNHLSEQEQRWWRHMLRRKARAEAAAQVRVQLTDYGLPCQARDGPGSEGKSLGCVVFGDAKYLDPAFMGSGRYGTASDVYALGVIMKELILRAGTAGKETRRPITRLPRNTSARASDSSSVTAAAAAAAAATAAATRAFPVSRSFPGQHASPAEPQPGTVTRGVSAAPAEAAPATPATPAGAVPAETAEAAGSGGESSRTLALQSPSLVETSSSEDPSLSHLAARFGPVRYHQASTLVQWCTERNPAHRPSSHEVEQLVKGMEGMNVVGELRRREMNGRRLRGLQWALLQ